MSARRDPGRYRGECERMHARALAAGLRVVGPIAIDLGWRPGIMLAHPVTHKGVWDFATANGYTATPNGPARTIVEAGRDR